MILAFLDYLTPGVYGVCYFTLFGLALDRTGKKNGSVYLLWLDNNVKRFYGFVACFRGYAGLQITRHVCGKFVKLHAAHPAKGSEYKGH